MNSITIIINFQQQQKIYNIEVALDTKIKDLIAELSPIVQPNAQQKIMLYSGQMVLNPHQTIQESGITKGQNIDLKLEALGGYFRQIIIK